MWKRRPSTTWKAPDKFMGTEKEQSAWSALCGGNPRNLGSLTQSWSESKYLPVPRMPTFACGYDFSYCLKHRHKFVVYSDIITTKNRKNADSVTAES